MQKNNDDNIIELSYEELLSVLNEKKSKAYRVAETDGSHVQIPHEICEQIYQEFFHMKKHLSEYGFMDTADPLELYKILKSNIVIPDTDTMMNNDNNSTDDLNENCDFILPYEEKCLYER